MISDVSIEEFARLAELFDELDWPTSQSDGSNSELLTTFSSLLSELDPRGRELVLTISRDFLWLPLARYDPVLELLTKQLTAKLSKGRTVITLPIADPKDTGKTKSGPLIQYLLRDKLSACVSAAGGTYYTWDRPSLVAEFLPNRQDALVVFVDDFLGTGHSAKAAISHFQANYSVGSDEIVVGVAAAQRAAIELLALDGIQSFVIHEKAKGITDSSRLPNVPEALTTMDSIEGSLGVRQRFRRGYEQSEALVAMHLCPNNTFPIYWWNKYKDGQPRAVPFQRR